MIKLWKLPAECKDFVCYGYFEGRQLKFVCNCRCLFFVMNCISVVHPKTPWISFGAKDCNYYLQNEKLPKRDVFSHGIQIIWVLRFRHF